MAVVAVVTNRTDSVIVSSQFIDDKKGGLAAFFVSVVALTERNISSGVVGSLQPVRQ